MTVETVPAPFGGVQKVYYAWFENKKHDKKLFAVDALLVFTTFLLLYPTYQPANAVFAVDTSGY